MAARINQENFEAEVLKAELPVLADFYSDSCVPCKRLSPLLAEVEEENADSLKVVKINEAAPTLILFKNGEEIDRLIGSVKKTEIIELINK